MFIDEVTITVKAGDGGNGCLAFRREKYVPRGGPSGGDGGRGGDVVLVSSEHYNTLLHFRFNPEHMAERGRHGEGSNRTGHDGASIEVPVPVGTIVYDAASGEQLFDFTAPGQRFTAARGGRGGRGNARFATSTHQAPTEHEQGHPGESFKLRLELKLLADAGLVGFPNAGKSTLISRLSAARPKIADYPFTTLEPGLGVVQAGDHSFVLADIPGLIEGAHEGHGLGIQFLRHIERTRLLVHLVDVSDFTGRDPGEDFDIILRELAEFSPELAKKPMIVVANKIDACQDASRVEAVRPKAIEHNLPFLEISNVTGQGIDELRYAISSALLGSTTQDTISVGS
ncbi:MAG: GTPase ObgE [Acidobacteriaceae bacterium]|nr:GTPase ObgE [Acidobacteriaceae bacterium]MBV9780453.1 GTPase ObgE [Acidobacteriaceae bacterium]